MSSKSDIQSEPGLVDRLCQGDPQALSTVYNNYARSVYALVVRITQDQGTAEDLVQELFLRLWIRCQLFDSKRGQFRPWLLSLARNMAIDHIRSSSAKFAKRLYPMEHVEPFGHASSLDNAGAIMARAISLKVALSRLNTNEKMVLQLAYFDGYSQAEIANLLDRPLGTVKSWTRSAIAHLGVDIKGYCRPNFNQDRAHLAVLRNVS
jgi:RNA polymerase sigma-70 factor, ECF subfamily